MSQESHPVWSVYDRLRSARLSHKYYCCKLEAAQRWALALDIVVAVAAPTSALAGVWLWKTATGQTIWQVIAGIAATVAVIKPLLHLTEKIKGYESFVAGYRMLDFDLMQIRTEIEQRQKYDVPMQNEFRKVQLRERALLERVHDAREDVPLKERLQAEVTKELPLEKFFIPKD